MNWIENEQLKKQLKEYEDNIANVKPGENTKENVAELKKKLKEAEGELARLKQPPPDLPASMANMEPSEMHEHFKSMNTNLALALAEKQGLMSKIKDLEQQLNESKITEGAPPASKAKGKGGRKDSKEEKTNLVSENEALQNKVEELETQLKDAKKAEKENRSGTNRGAAARAGKKGAKEDR